MDLCERELPEWLRELLFNPPAAGSGLNNWIFRCARGLKPHRSDTEAAALIYAQGITAGRPAAILTKEISRAVGRAGNEWAPGAGAPFTPPIPAPKWPARDLDAIAGLSESRRGLADLADASPTWRDDSDPPFPEELADLLFPGSPLLCLGTKPQDAITRPREDWRGTVGNYGLIVPSPMTAPTGTNQDGAPSARCLDNTGPRRWLVVECDFQRANKDGSPTPEAPLLTRLEADGRTVHDLCAAVLMHLAQFAPLALAVHSGGKSLHGWFPAASVPDKDLAKFFALAVRLGADPATWTRCQLVRLPEGRRDNGKAQPALYLNLEAIDLNNQF